MVTRYLFSALAMFALLAATGCGARGNAVHVQGLATLDGQPLAGADIQFIPKGKDSLGTLSATTDADGSFTIDARSLSEATTGTYAVTVRKYGGNNMALANTVPAIYADPERTPLHAELHVGSNDLPAFGLMSRPLVSGAGRK